MMETAIPMDTGLDALNQAQHEIIDEFGLFDDWLERYQYIIDLGKKLEPLDAAEKKDEALLDGCQSRVWLLASGDADCLRFRAASDAAIVSGLIYLLLRVYSGRSADAILTGRPFFVDELGLSEHLSSTRANGLNAMLTEIHRLAKQVQLSA